MYDGGNDMRKKNTFWRDWSGDIKVEWQIIGAMLGLIVLCFVCVASVELMQHWWDTAQCNQLANMNPQFDFNFTYLNGCMVKTHEGNAWISATKILELINQ